MCDSGISVDDSRIAMYIRLESMLTCDKHSRISACSFILTAFIVFLTLYLCSLLCVYFVFPCYKTSSLQVVSVNKNNCFVPFVFSDLLTNFFFCARNIVLQR